MTKSLWCFVVAIATLALAATGAAAQTPGPQMTVTPAWEGSLRLPGWTEFLVRLTNEGADWEGTLAIVDEVNQVTYRYPVLLPAHSQKQYRLPYFADTSAFTLKVRLEGPAGTVQSVPVRVRPPADNQAVCVVVERQAALVLGPAALCPAQIALRDLSTLPESAPAWDTVDLLVLNGISTADLTAGQRETLLAWVAAGGRLVVAGGPALPQVLAGLPEPLQIGTVGAPTQLLLPEAGGTTVPAVPLTPAAGASSFLERGGSHFALHQAVGAGQITLLGWELAGPATQLWPPEFWPPAALPVVTWPLSDQQSLSVQALPDAGALAQVPTRFLAAIWKWLLFFPLYILIMGPGTWWLVRRLRRPLLAWLLFPLWVGLALIILALALNGVFSHLFPLVHQVAYVSVPGPGLPARVVQSMALYAPQARSLSWEMGGAPRPLWGSLGLNDTYSSNGEPFPAVVSPAQTGARVSTTAVQGVLTWATEGLGRVPTPQTAFTITLNQGQPFLSGGLQSEQPLRNVALVMDNGRYWVPLTDTMAADQWVGFSQPFSTTQTPSWSYNNDLCTSNNYYNAYSTLAIPGAVVDDVRQRQLDQSCYLVARSAGVPFPLAETGGTSYAETCLFYTIPCPVSPQGYLQLGPALLFMTQGNTSIGSDGVLYTQQPSTEVQYDYPSFLRLRVVTHLTLTLAAPAWMALSSGYVPYTGTLALWDWEGERWVDYPPPAPGDSLWLSGAEAQPFADPVQGVRVRLSPVIGTEGPLRAWLALEGYR